MIIPIFLLLGIQIILNFIIYFVFKKKKKTGISILDYEIKKRIKYIKKAEWLLEKVIIAFVMCIFFHIDLIYNLNKSSKRYNVGSLKRSSLTIEIIVLIYLGIGILFYAISSLIKDSNTLLIYDLIISNFFLWRLTSIFFIRVNEISLFKYREIKYISFFRTTIFIFINFIEIVIAYSFLYSSKAILIIPERKLSTLLDTLNVFVNWNIVNSNVLCYWQLLLIISQIIFFITVISIFISNAVSLNYQNKGSARYGA